MGLEQTSNPAPQEGSKKYYSKEKVDIEAIRRKNLEKLIKGKPQAEQSEKKIADTGIKKYKEGQFSLTPEERARAEKKGTLGEEREKMTSVTEELKKAQLEAKREQYTRELEEAFEAQDEEDKKQEKRAA